MVALNAPAVDTLAERVKAAQSELQASIDRAGLRDDVIRHPLLALASTVGLFPGLVDELRQALEEARRPVDSAAVERIEFAAATGAAQRAADLARAFNWRTILLAGVAVIAIVVIAVFGGYMLGRSSAVATVSAVQAAALRDGPDAAAMWANLMAANDGGLVARACRETGAKSDGGRRACVLALWTEAPINPAPRTVPASK